jgi:hypothetical protein
MPRCPVGLRMSGPERTVLVRAGDLLALWDAADGCKRRATAPPVSGFLLQTCQLQRILDRVYDHTRVCSASHQTFLNTTGAARFTRYTWTSTVESGFKTLVLQPWHTVLFVRGGKVIDHTGDLSEDDGLVA